MGWMIDGRSDFIVEISQTDFSLCPWVCVWFSVAEQKPSEKLREKERKKGKKRRSNKLDDVFYDCIIRFRWFEKQFQVEIFEIGRTHNGHTHYHDITICPVHTWSTKLFASYQCNGAMAGAREASRKRELSDRGVELPTISKSSNLRADDVFISIKDQLGWKWKRILPMTALPN